VDVLTPELRSFNMSRIRGWDTKPELTLRRGLHPSRIPLPSAPPGPARLAESGVLTDDMPPSSCTETSGCRSVSGVIVSWLGTRPAGSTGSNAIVFGLLDRRIAAAELRRKAAFAADCMGLMSARTRRRRYITRRVRRMGEAVRR